MVVYAVEAETREAAEAMIDEDFGACEEISVDVTEREVERVTEVGQCVICGMDRERVALGLHGDDHSYVPYLSAAS